MGTGVQRKLFVVAAAIAVLLGGFDEAQAAKLSGSSANLDKTWFYNTTIYSDLTAAALDATANDVTLASVLNSIHYAGMDYVFDKLVYNVGVAGTLGTVVWEYWNGSSWTSLSSVTDNTTSFKTSGTNSVTFTIPSDWATTAVNAITKYYIRGRTSVLYGVTALGTQVSAREYNLKIKVQDELGNVLTGLTSSALSISGGTDNTLHTFREIGSGTYEASLDATEADTNFDYTVSKDGYVTSSSGATGALTTALTDLTGTPRSLSFAVQATVDDETITNDLISGATVTTGNSFGTSCTASGSSYYCAVPLADTATDVKIVKDGYVTKTLTSAFTDRTLNADSQRLVTSTNVQPGFKVTVRTESGNLLSGATVTTGDSFGVSCTEDGTSGVYYCLVPEAQTGLTVRVAKGSFVTNSGNAFSTDRTVGTDAQVALSINNIQYAAIGNFATGNTSPTSIAVQWTASTDPTFDKYELYVGTVPGVNYTNGVAWTTSSDALLDATSTSATTLTSLTPNTSYYLAIYALDISGNRSVVSSELSIRTPSLPSPGSTDGVTSHTLEFSAAPATTTPGESVLLSWASNTAMCIPVGGWSEQRGTSGQERVYPVNTRDYEISCVGAAGNIKKIVRVAVSETRLETPPTSTTTAPFSATSTTHRPPLTLPVRVLPMHIPATTLSLAIPKKQKAPVLPIFKRNLHLGERGDDVKRLQELLARDSDIYPERLLTGYFGPATRRAIGRFQAKYNIVASRATEGYGQVGPRTRMMLMIVFGRGQSVAQLMRAESNQRAVGQRPQEP